MAWPSTPRTSTGPSRDFYSPMAPGSGEPTSMAAARIQHHRRSQRAMWDRRLRPAALLGERGKQRDRQGEHRFDRGQSILHPNWRQSDLRRRRRCPAAAAGTAQAARRLSEPGRRRGRQGRHAARDEDHDRPRQEARPGQGEVLLRVERGRLDLHLQVRRQEAGGLHITEALLGRAGKHVLKIWATDRAGNKCLMPAKRRFTVPAPA